MKKLSRPLFNTDGHQSVKGATNNTGEKSSLQISGVFKANVVSRDLIGLKWKKHAKNTNSLNILYSGAKLEQLSKHMNIASCNS